MPQQDIQSFLLMIFLTSKHCDAGLDFIKLQILYNTIKYLQDIQSNHNSHIINQMKYQINYNRQIPTHRVLNDHFIYLSMKNISPFQFFGIIKQGCYKQFINYPSVTLAGLSLIGLAIVGGYIFWDVDVTSIYGKKFADRPEFKYLLYSQNPAAGPFNSLTFRFANQKLGNKDVSFDQ